MVGGRRLAPLLVFLLVVGSYAASSVGSGGTSQQQEVDANQPELRYDHDRSPRPSVELQCRARCVHGTCTERSEAPGAPNYCECESGYVGGACNVQIHKSKSYAIVPRVTPIKTELQLVDLSSPFRANGAEVVGVLCDDVMVGNLHALPGPCAYSYTDSSLFIAWTDGDHTDGPELSQFDLSGNFIRTIRSSYLGGPIGVDEDGFVYLAGLQEPNYVIKSTPAGRVVANYTYTFFVVGGIVVDRTNERLLVVSRESTGSLELLSFPLGGGAGTHKAWLPMPVNTLECIDAMVTPKGGLIVSCRGQLAHYIVEANSSVTALNINMPPIQVINPVGYLVTAKLGQGAEYDPTTDYLYVNYQANPLQPGNTNLQDLLLVRFKLEDAIQGKDIHPQVVTKPDTASYPHRSILASFETIEPSPSPSGGGGFTAGKLVEIGIVAAMAGTVIFAALWAVRNVRKLQRARARGEFGDAGSDSAAEESSEEEEPSKSLNRATTVLGDSGPLSGVDSALRLADVLEEDEHGFSPAEYALIEDEALDSRLESKSDKV